MSSAAGRHGYAYRTPYAAAKFGVIGFTQTLPRSSAPPISASTPSFPASSPVSRMENVIRERARQLGLSYEDMEARYLEKVSLRRMVKPEDVAAMVAFLLSDAGRNISGQSLGIDANVETL